MRHTIEMDHAEVVEALYVWLQQYRGVKIDRSKVDFKMGSDGKIEMKTDVTDVAAIGGILGSPSDENNMGGINKP